MSAVRLQLGDVLVERHGDGTSSTYTLESWSPRGKAQFRRPSGTIMSGWWRTPASLPKRFEVWRGEERLA